MQDRQLTMEFVAFGDFQREDHLASCVSVYIPFLEHPMVRSWFVSMLFSKCFPWLSAILFSLSFLINRKLSMIVARSLKTAILVCYQFRVIFIIKVIIEFLLFNLASKLVLIL